MRRLIWGVAIMLLVGPVRAQLPKPGVPDIPAMQALWANIKRQLSAPDGEKYFEENLRDSALPYLYGVVLSATPRDRPSSLVLAMSDKSTPEVSLELEGRATETIRDGAEIIFDGVAKSFTQRPFRLTIALLGTIRVHDSSH